MKPCWSSIWRASRLAHAPEQVGQLGDSSADALSISFAGGFVQAASDLRDLRKSEGAACSGHPVAQFPDRLVILPSERALDGFQVAAPARQITRREGAQPGLEFRAHAVRTL